MFLTSNRLMPKNCKWDADALGALRACADFRRYENWAKSLKNLVNLRASATRVF